MKIDLSGNNQSMVLFDYSKDQDGVEGVGGGDLCDL